MKSCWQETTFTAVTGMIFHRKYEDEDKARKQIGGIFLDGNDGIVPRIDGLGSHFSVEGFLSSFCKAPCLRGVRCHIHGACAGFGVFILQEEQAEMVLSSPHSEGIIGKKQDFAEKKEGSPVFSDSPFLSLILHM